MGTRALAKMEIPQAPGDDGWPEGRDLYPEELETLEKVRIEESKRFLFAFAQCWNVSHAARAVNRSPSCLVYWRRSDPAFKEIYEALEGERLENWRALAARKARTGFTKRLYTPQDDGTLLLKAVEVREDPSHLKAVMGSIDPDWRSDPGAGNITINIVRVGE